MYSTQSLIFAIKRYALHDGPNIRTTIFFKGCPLSCFWCHNPEGISPQVEVISVGNRCIGCRECLHGCPQQALSICDAEILRNNDQCNGCLNCVEICPSLVHEASGRLYSHEAIMHEIGKDLPFYDQSGGGVTFSGGEPLLQAESLLVLLKKCGELGIHRALDTSGFAATEKLLEAARSCELVLYDLKHMDIVEHKRITGVANDLIIHNLEQLDRTKTAYRIRIPLLAGINDDDDNILAIGSLAARLHHLQGIDLLPYHHLAQTKYRKLDLAYRAGLHQVPGTVSTNRVRKLLESYGHTVRIGG